MSSLRLSKEEAAAKYPVFREPGYYRKWIPFPKDIEIDADERDRLMRMERSLRRLDSYDTRKEAAEQHGTLITANIDLDPGYAYIQANYTRKKTKATDKPARRERGEGLSEAQKLEMSPQYWRMRSLSLTDSFNVLEQGYSTSYGICERAGHRIRLSKLWHATQFIAFDLDEYADDLTEPQTIEEALDAFHGFEDFMYLQESLSSRWDGRPVKLRGIVAFKKPVTDKEVLKTIAGFYTDKYPCSFGSVGNNSISIAYGNGNPERWTRTNLGVYVPDEVIENAKDIAVEIRKGDAVTKTIHAVDKDIRELRNDLEQRVTEKSRDRGKDVNPSDPPLRAFRHASDIHLRWLVESGLMKRDGGGRFTWIGSESQMGVWLGETEEGEINVRSYSSHAHAAYPPSVPTTDAGMKVCTVSNLRLWIEYGIDIGDAPDYDEVAQILAEAGWGRYQSKEEYEEQIELTGEERVEVYVDEIRNGGNPMMRRQPRLYPHRTPEDERFLNLVGLQEQRDEVKDLFIEAKKNEHKINVIIAQTGSGKTEQSLQTDDWKLIVTSRVALRNETVQRADALEKITHNYLPVKHGIQTAVPAEFNLEGQAIDRFLMQYSSPKEANCGQPFLRDYMTKAGLSPYNVCATCSWLDECLEEGHLSQPNKARHSEVVVSSFQQVLTNPIYAVSLKRMFQTPPKPPKEEREDDYEDIIRIAHKDEIPQNYFCEPHLIPFESFRYHAGMWGTEHAIGRFNLALFNLFKLGDALEQLRTLRRIYDNLTLQEFNEINTDYGRVLLPCYRQNTSWIEVADDKGRMVKASRVSVTILGKTFYEAISDYAYRLMQGKGMRAVRPFNPRYGEKHIAIPSNELIRLGVKPFDYYQDGDLDCLPIYTWTNPDATPLSILSYFFQHYGKGHPENLPVSFDREGDKKGINLVIPPVVSDIIGKLIITSAVADEGILRRVFKDLYITRAKEAYIVKGAEIHQIDTGAYMLSSITNACKENNYLPTAFSKTGHALVKRIIQEAIDYPDREFVLFSMKKVIDLIHKVFNVIPDNLLLFHYQEIEGLDSTFENTYAFYLLGSPNISDDDVIRQTKILYGVDEDEIPFDKYPDGHERAGEFIDWRPQHIAEIHVKDLILQAIGRGRLQIKPRHVVICTYVYLEGITPIANRFQPYNLLVSKTVDELYAVAEEQRKYEDVEASWDHTVSIETIMKTLARSKRHAYRYYKERFGKSYKHSDDNLVQQVILLRKQGMTIREIEHAMRNQPKMKRGRISKICKAEGI